MDEHLNNLRVWVSQVYTQANINNVLDSSLMFVVVVLVALIAYLLAFVLKGFLKVGVQVVTFLAMTTLMAMVIAAILNRI